MSLPNNSYISLLSCDNSSFGEMIVARLIPKGSHDVCEVESGCFLVSQLGSESPRPQAGCTYKISAVTTREAQWDRLGFQLWGNIMSFELLANTNSLHSLTG